METLFDFHTKNGVLSVYLNEEEFDGVAHIGVSVYFPGKVEILASPLDENSYAIVGVMHDKDKPHPHLRRVKGPSN